MDVGGTRLCMFRVEGGIVDLYLTAKLQQDNNGNIFVNANGEIISKHEKLSISNWAVYSPNVTCRGVMTLLIRI